MPRAMKILSWNACGLGNPRAFRALVALLKARSPQAFFLSKTKSGKEVASRVKILGSFHGCLSVDSERSRGGLYLLWKEEVDLEVLSYSHNHIYSRINWEGKAWRFTGIYGHSEGHKKHLTWDLI